MLRVHIAADFSAIVTKQRKSSQALRGFQKERIKFSPPAIFAQVFILRALALENRISSLFEYCAWRCSFLLRGRWLFPNPVCRSCDCASVHSIPRRPLTIWAPLPERDDGCAFSSKSRNRSTVADFEHVLFYNLSKERPSVGSGSVWRQAVPSRRYRSAASLVSACESKPRMHIRSTAQAGAKRGRSRRPGRRAGLGPGKVFVRR